MSSTTSGHMTSISSGAINPFRPTHPQDINNICNVFIKTNDTTKKNPHIL